MSFVLLLTTAIIINAAVCEDILPRVSIPLGQIEGFTKQTVKGRTIYAFEGVPYARPPVGKYRFKESIPPKPWIGVWQAKTMFHCMQYDHFTPPGQEIIVSGDEDCLYVNVYSPNLNPTNKLDVLIFIHGGAFMFGHGGLYGPEILLDKDVVFVNFNYRLGPLGFLSTEDGVVPGNNGLKDQIQALKWIKDNIQYFGGNPDSITITGLSAGGASVHFHYLLPESKGLFHKGISQSGAVLNNWVLVENPLEKAKKLSDIVGCPTVDIKQMIKCLRYKPGRQIVQAVKHFQPWLYNPFTPFGVVVDTWATDPVLPDHPYNLLKNKKVQDLPWIISYTSAEGLYPAADFYYTHHLEYIDRNWNKIMPYILHYNEVVDHGQLDDVSQKIRQRFFQERKVTKETFSALVELMSDRLFINGIDEGGRLHSAAIKSPVYSYYFNYRGAHSESESRSNSTDDIGVSHGDDTNYVLKTSVMDTLSTDDDKLMTDVLVNIFTSFMKSGKPDAVPEWKPLSKKPSDPWIHLRIDGPRNIFVEQKDELGNAGFWKTLPFKENERLFTAKDEL